MMSQIQKPNPQISVWMLFKLAKIYVTLNLSLQPHCRITRSVNLSADPLQMG